MKYDKAYWDAKRTCGAIGGSLNLFKFAPYIQETDHVLDFGCGGGFLLNNIKCAQKTGFDVNPHALAHAKKFKIFTTSKWGDISDLSIDITISNHALEHVPLPLETLKAIYLKLKPNGKIVLVVPCEQAHKEGFLYHDNDINQHLHTWCPQALGNLAKVAGYTNISCTPLQHQWTPQWLTEYQNPLYHQKCEEFAQKNGNFQVKLVASKG